MASDGRIDMSLDTIIKRNRKTARRSQVRGKHSRSGATRSYTKQTGRNSHQNMNRPIGILRNGRATTGDSFARNQKGRGRKRFGKPEANVAGVKLFREAFKESEFDHKPSKGTRTQSREGKIRNSSGRDFSSSVGGKATVRGSIKKRSVNSSDGGNLKLFTKNFDARKKIEEKRNRSGVTDAGSQMKKTLENIRAEKRSALVLGHRKLPVVNESVSVSSRQELAEKRISELQGKLTPVTAVSRKHDKGDTGVVHFPNRSLTGPTVTCEYDEPSMSLQRTIRPRVQEQDTRTYQSTAKTILRPSDSYVSTLVSKRKQPSTTQKELNKIVVTNLHPNVTTEDIRELFGAVGDFTSAKLLQPGIAEVIYDYADDALLAFKKYHSRNLDGQPMICKLMNTNQVLYQPSSSSFSSSRSKDLVQKTSIKPVVFTVKI